MPAAFSKSRIASVSLCMLFVMSGVQYSVAGMPCETLKSKIEDGLKAKGVQGYSLTVVDKSDTTTPGNTVGTCEGGTKKIVYSREGAKAEVKPAAEKQTDTKKPAETK